MDLPRVSGLRKPGTAELLAGHIRESIATGEFAPGTTLPQEALAARYEVSRSPLREALRLLEAEGAIVYHANRGAIVARYDANEIGQILEIRGALEEALVKYAVPNVTPYLIAQLRLTLQSLDEITDPREWLAQHNALHAALYAAAKRPKMQALVTQYILPVSHLPDAAQRVAALRPLVQRADALLLDACADGSARKAVAALHTHNEPLLPLLCGPLPHEEAR